MIAYRQIWASAICVMLGLSLVSSGCSRRQAQGGLMVQVKGSDTMVNLGQSWAASFMEKNPTTYISVTGGGSGTGIASMINGTADVAMASREMEPKEIQQMKAKGADPNEIIVARDAVAVVINPSNPVSKLTMDQLSDIYTGKITNWKQLGGKDQPIVALSRDKNSGTHVYFLEHVLRHGNAKGPEEYASEVLMMPSSQAIADEVKTNQAAIGYFGLGYLNKKDQKPVAVAKSAGSAYVEPSEKTVLSGQYPISRPLYLYTNGKPKGSIAKFVDFVLSSKGQSLVLKEGFVPLKGNR